MADSGASSSIFTVKIGIKVGLLWAAEYAMLSLIEDAPRIIKWATLIFPLAGLAIIQFEDKLRTKHRDLFGATISVLAIGYLLIAAIFGYIYAPTVHQQIDNPIAGATTSSPTNPTATTAEPLIKYPIIVWDGHGPILFKGQFARSGEKLPVYLDWSVLAPADQGVLSGDFVPLARVEIGFVERFVRNEVMNVTLGLVSPEANHQTIQWGEDHYHNPKIPMFYQTIVGRIVMVHRDNDEEYYPFMIVCRAIGNQAATPTILTPGLLDKFAKWEHGLY